MPSHLVRAKINASKFLFPSADWECVVAMNDSPSAEIQLTFLLTCFVIDLFLNNQADALIIQMYSVIKLYMFRASSLPIIRSFPLYMLHW
jgi:hypothetical protein